MMFLSGEAAIPAPPDRPSLSALGATPMTTDSKPEANAAIVLTEEGSRRFFDAIMNPQPPSPRLVAAAARYKRRMGLDHGKPEEAAQ
jgi:hypothetical protein